MFSRLGEFLLQPGDRPLDVELRLSELAAVGAKGCGLAIIPRDWTPRYIIISTQVYHNWRLGSDTEKNDLLALLSGELCNWCSDQWPESRESGIVLRSSAVKETLKQRGAYDSIELPADYGTDIIRESIIAIFENFYQSDGDGYIAIIVQERAPILFKGHLSNERRVSKTVNQWMWEVEPPAASEGRFNSQRASAPDPLAALNVGAYSRSFIEKLKEVGCWCAALGRGRAHLEWGADARTVWLFQIDFEDDQPDEGVDPRTLLRQADLSIPSVAPSGSPFQLLVPGNETGWGKLDKVRILSEGRSDPYPSLYYITGAQLRAAMAGGRDIVADIQAITVGRAVCRTDCVTPSIPRLNLPRTESVGAQEALSFMSETLAALQERGAAEEEVCFIIHKFIAATVAAWARAEPGRQLVLVDSLWGLPDGLQYLNHDTFEYDVKRGEISSDKIRFKPHFLQETESGEWKLVRVSRPITRFRSLKQIDLHEVALHTHSVALRTGRPVQIMWFCDVLAAVGVGRNVPWFMMPPESEHKSTQSFAASVGLRKYPVRNMDDIKVADSFESGRYNLQLEPEADYFRNNDFIDGVVELATRKQFPVTMTGSILSHAFYALERSGVAVTTVNSGRSRVRQRQVFKKLVRDEIPTKIAEQGERVTLAHIEKSEARTALVIKLFEEAHELLSAGSLPDVAAELADLLEVVRALSRATGVPWDEVQRLAEEKRKARGGFERNLVLLETSWPAWGANGTSEREPTISLRELARTVSADGKHTLSLPSVLVNGADNEINLADGKRISISMGAAGIEIRELTSTENLQSQQLEFGF